MSGQNLKWFCKDFAEQIIAINPLFLFQYSATLVGMEVFQVKLSITFIYIYKAKTFGYLMLSQLQGHKNWMTSRFGTCVKYGQLSTIHRQLKHSTWTRS